MSEPKVAIVGRPNVGKSSLLNRLIQRRDAIVEPTPGVTRDRLYRKTCWNGKDFLLVDTGGLLDEDPDQLKDAIRSQIRAAVEEADLVLLVVDVKEGLHPLDQDVAAFIRMTGKKSLLAANKADNVESFPNAAEFFSLGVGEPIPVSAIHGIGTGDLLDMITTELPGQVNGPAEVECTRISIVGRPNVGKSSLMNAMLGHERAIVTDIPGTTRDAVDSAFRWGGEEYIILDTAGIRRRGKIEDGIEYYSTQRAKRAIKSSHVCLLVLDATEPGVGQDQKIGGMLEEWGKATIIVVNKWDLLRGESVEEDEFRKGEFIRNLRKELNFLFYAPILFTSAINSEGISQLMPSVARIYRECNKRIDTPLLNKLFQDAFFYRSPPSYKGESLKLLYVTQQGVCPPTFILKVNSPKLIHFSYRRYLENQLRRVLKFEGTPVKFIFKK